MTLKSPRRPSSRSGATRRPTRRGFDPATQPSLAGVRSDGSAARYDFSLPPARSAPCERPFGIVPALRILQRLQMREHLDMRQPPADVVLERLGEVVRLLHAHAPRHED